jgi:peptidoglycan-associated lipoprotein
MAHKRRRLSVSQDRQQGVLMRMSRWGGIALRFVLVGTLSATAAGCAEKPKLESELNDKDGAGGPVTPGSAREFAVRVGDTVYFTTDSTDLTPDAENTLRAQAGWLKKYPTYGITIEGHADERGTREYNLALGAKRAATVRAFLAGQGLDAARIRTLSYGKERPVAVCNDISCWSQNRRAQTALSKRAGS